MDGDEEEGAGMAHPLLLPVNPPAAYQALLDPSSSEQHQGEHNDALDAAQEDAAGTAAAAPPPVAGTSYPQATDDEMGNATSRALNGVLITAANASSAASGDNAENNPPNVGRSAAIAERGGKRRAEDDYHADDSPTGESARYLAGGGAVSSQESMPSPSKKARREQDLSRIPSGLGRAQPQSQMPENSEDLIANCECAVGVARLAVVAVLTPPSHKKSLGRRSPARSIGYTASKAAPTLYRNLLACRDHHWLGPTLCDAGKQDSRHRCRPPYTSTSLVG